MKELDYSVSCKICSRRPTFCYESGILAIQASSKQFLHVFETQTSLTISDSEEVYTKTLGIEWHSVLDHFRLSVIERSPPKAFTKRALVSDIAKTYDVLGLFAPAIVKVKILLQRVWEAKVDWDDLVPQPILEEWLLWRAQLSSLSQKHIPRCYFPKEVQVVSTQTQKVLTLELSTYAW